MEKNIDKVETPVAEQIESSHYNVDYILEQLSFMAKQTALITDAFEKVSDMPDSGDVNSVAIQAKAQAVTETVKARETTNQQLIRLYEKMYDNIIGQGSASSKVNLFVPLLELIDDDELKANLIATKIVDAVLS